MLAASSGHGFHLQRFQCRQHLGQVIDDRFVSGLDVRDQALGPPRSDGGEPCIDRISQSLVAVDEAGAV